MTIGETILVSVAAGPSQRAMVISLYVKVAEFAKMVTVNLADLMQSILLICLNSPLTVLHRFY